VTVGLLEQAERIRVEATLILDGDAQSDRGQFFTPDLAAALIAGLPSQPSGPAVRVLDPGAGSGMLTAALVERACREGWPGRIEVTAVEVDPALVPALRQTAVAAEDFACRHGLGVRVDVVQADFIELSTGLDARLAGDYDVVIMNPPYRKLAASAWQRRALAALGWECPNLYAAFVALGVEALRDGGQLVAITPRSFANGPYFGQFRRHLLDAVAIDRLHTFESRSSVFADTGVLQENVVFSATKGGRRDRVRITCSRDHHGGQTERIVAYTDLVLPDDPERFIRITSDDDGDEAVQYVAALPASLGSLGLTVSTGRVVDFRAQGNLTRQPTPEGVPLVYPGNLRDGLVRWPREIGKDQGFVALQDGDRKSLMPGGCYVLVKRFSAKEERRRIVAAVWDPDLNGDTPVAFENHLNVFHHDGRGLDPELAWGLCLWLNTTVVDRCFRTFSGHTQVNATDLRSMRYPDEIALRALGRSVDRLPGQDELDRLVERGLWEKVAA
jgi:adenine-specific DNA-methyltransferase